jgi:hypothetical protein
MSDEDAYIDRLLDEIDQPVPVEDPVAHEIAAGRPPRHLKLV